MVIVVAYMKLVLGLIMSHHIRFL
ncbi:BnaC03g61290D [Brassica napus]|uniref:BnaC03g61290D protein n=1 Tax=Brassica napus TaxID=3708 RepID=A0A078IK35_BRANA|nr:BnaC03g61290D [Brassica napus]